MRFQDQTCEPVPFGFRENLIGETGGFDPKITKVIGIQHSVHHACGGNDPHHPLARQAFEVDHARKHDEPQNRVDRKTLIERPLSRQPLRQQPEAAHRCARKYECRLMFRILPRRNDGRVLHDQRPADEQHTHQGDQATKYQPGVAAREIRVVEDEEERPDIKRANVQIAVVARQEFDQGLLTAGFVPKPPPADQTDQRKRQRDRCNGPAHVESLVEEAGQPIGQQEKYCGQDMDEEQQERTDCNSCAGLPARRSEMEHQRRKQKEHRGHGTDETDEPPVRIEVVDVQKRQYGKPGVATQGSDQSEDRKWQHECIECEVHFVRELDTRKDRRATEPDVKNVGLPRHLEAEVVAELIARFTITSNHRGHAQVKRQIDEGEQFAQQQQ